MKKTILTLFTVMIIAIIILAGMLSFNLDLNIKVRKQLDRIFESYEIEKIDPSVFIVDSNRIIEVDNSKQLYNRFLDTGKTYMDLEWISDEYTTYHVDQAKKQIHIATPEQLIVIHAGGEIYLNGELYAEKVEWIQIDNKNYLEFGVLKNIEGIHGFGIDQRPVEQNMNIIFVNKEAAYKEIFVDHETLVFKSEESLRSHYNDKERDSFYYDLKNIFQKPTVLNQIDQTTVIAEVIEGDILKIAAPDGVVGYISLLDQEAMIEVVADPIQPLPSIKLDVPVYLTWEAVYSYNPNTENIPPMPGVNVLSPTWYELSDKDGKVDAKVSDDYIAWAQGQGIQIWALVSNAFDIERTHEFLHNSDARTRFIEYMISEANSKGYQGINIDFENVYLEDKDALTHFVNEFRWHAHANDLILSMDVTVMGGSDTWSKCYDHPKLGKIVDYLIIMTYDEYWQSSPISGPVASYDWVYRHMLQLSEVVAPEKLVLGLPTYTRVWRERPSSQNANVMTTSSSAIGMEAQNNLIEKYELTPIWDDVDKLYYATFFEEDALVKMWIETPETLAIRAELVNELGLGGIAIWRRGFETQDVWDKLNQVIN